MKNTLWIALLLVLAVSFCPHPAFADEAGQVDPTALQGMTEREALVKLFSGSDNRSIQLVDTQPSVFDLNRQGKRLRSEIERVFKELRSSGKLKSQNPISDLVMKYVPVGTSFKDAEAILRSAEWKIRITQGSLKAVGHFSDIPQFSKAELIIGLLPRIPEDFQSGVGKVEAYIIYTTL